MERTFVAKIYMHIFFVKIIWQKSQINLTFVRLFFRKR